MVEATFLTGVEARLTPYSSTPKPLPSNGRSLEVEYRSTVVRIVLCTTGNEFKRFQNRLPTAGLLFATVASSPSRGAIFRETILLGKDEKRNLWNKSKQTKTLRREKPTRCQWISTRGYLYAHAQAPPTWPETVVNRTEQQIIRGYLRPNYSTICSVIGYLVNIHSHCLWSAEKIRKNSFNS